MSDESAIVGRPPAGQDRARPASPPRSDTRRDAWLRALLVLAACIAYAQTSLILDIRNAASSFGADSVLYYNIGFGDVEDRLTRFHPVTVLLAVGWMKIAGAMFNSVAPKDLLSAMFAVAGAAGVWAALSAFRALVPRRFVLLCGFIYAASLGVWYFSSIAESKIVTASLASIYIAIYVHLREQWTPARAAWLSITLFAACMNEIVSALLVVIPAVDYMLQPQPDRLPRRWLFKHALAAVAAYLTFEIYINRILLEPATQMEGGSAYSMFLFYMGINDHGLASLYAFLLNWLFFNIAAPEHGATHAITLWPTYQGYFQPAFTDYFSDLTPALLVGVVAFMALVSILPRYRALTTPAGPGLMPALIAYSLARGAFFFVFNPPEALLFSPGVTLAHLLLVLVPFSASRFQGKGPLLFAAAMLLFLNNLQFVGGELFAEPANPF
ncbi:MULTISPECIES: hypothetical protein [Rhodomicrobium]|uniref:hypothetical protein n=1 Tax=Rhodomicrobium TaxID=1068 RepID=UPI000B4B097F|nr:MULTISPECIES: hypothetical protein [Rhodomicrobium]